MFTPKTNATQATPFTRFSIIAALAALTCSLTFAAGAQPGDGHGHGRGQARISQPDTPYIVSLPRGGSRPGGTGTTVTTAGMRVELDIDDATRYIVTLDPPGGGVTGSDPNTTVDGLRKNSGENNGHGSAREYIVSLPRGGSLPGGTGTTFTTAGMQGGVKLDAATPYIVKLDPPTGGSLSATSNSRLAPVGSASAPLSGARLDLSSDGSRRINPAYIRLAPLAAGNAPAWVSISGDGARGAQAMVSFTLR